METTAVQQVNKRRRGRPRSVRPLRTIVGTLMTEELKDQLIETADELGVSMSDLVRTAVSEFVVGRKGTLKVQ